MKYKKEELIAGNSLDVKETREKFIKEYAANKGWDHENLTTEQMKEIKSQDGYKNPGMLLS
jgi:hypothetical protein